MGPNFSIMKLALNLCAGDISCGFIPLNPVLDNRDQLIDERLEYYLNILPEKYPLWYERLSNIIPVPIIRDGILNDVSIMVNSDMISGAIPLKPVLVDRDLMIFQRFDFYFEITLSKASHLDLSCEQPSINNSVEQIVFLVKKVISKKRRKGLKSRRR
ncbi:hypothetical protein NA236_06275 [Salmonella sp. NW826]|uniref:hypothetical protein n=1 Tax=Salmonella sp. NW826 TaxID=2948311 RepID=UPI003F4337F0